MAISNLNNELYEDDMITEEVTSSSFSDYVPESPIKKPEEIKESLLGDLKNVATSLKDTLGAGEDVTVEDILKDVLKSTINKNDGSPEGDEDETLQKVAKIIADSNLEEKVDFFCKNFPQESAEKLLQRICGFNEKESKFIIEN